MARIHCLLSLGKDKGEDAEGVSDVSLVRAPGENKCKDLSHKFAISFHVLKIYEANFFPRNSFLPFNSIFTPTLHIN